MKRVSELSDDELIQRIVSSGNTTAFGELYDRYAQLVYAKCKNFVSKTDEVDDLVQDIFVGVYVKLKTFRGDSKFSTWLYAFTYNHCVNHYNREVKKKRLEVNFEEDQGEVLKMEDEISDETIFLLAADKLKMSLQQIEPTDKVVLLMKYQDDMTIKDMAKALGLGESAIKMRLLRAKKRIVEIYNSL